MDAREAADDGAGSEPESAMDVPRGAGDQFDTPCDAAPARAARAETDAPSDVDAPGAPGDDGLVCAICLVDGRDDAAARWKQTSCRHRFHGWCLEKWLAAHATCPMCRHHVTLPPVSRASFQTGTLAYDSSDEDSFDSSDEDSLDSSYEDSLDSFYDDSFDSSDDDSFDSSDDSSGAEDADDDEQEVAGGAEDTNEDAAAPVESMDVD